MPDAIAMPKLGMQMRAGTVLEWCARLGERVERGRVVARIEFEKAEADLEAPASGMLRHIYVAPGQTVACGTLLAALTRDAGEPFDAEAYARAMGPPAAEPRAHAPRAARTERDALPAGAESGAITPAARRRARELGIDAARVRGSGPAGRVTREDIEAYAALVPASGGVRLEAPSEGSGELALLLPGFGSTRAAFARQIPVLAAQHRVRTVHARGMGLSDAPACDAYTVETAAADTAALLDEPAHLVGASLGAAVALEVALAAPERVRSLTLITPFLEASPRLLAVIDAWCRLAAGAPDLLALVLLPWLFGPRTLADEAARRRALRGLAEMSGSLAPEALARQAAGLRAWRAPSAARLAALRVPALVIGARDDLLAPHAEEVAKQLPGACVQSVPDAGHAVSLEAHEAVSAALLGHLAGAARR